MLSLMHDAQLVSRALAGMAAACPQERTVAGLLMAIARASIGRHLPPQSREALATIVRDAVLVCVPSGQWGWSELTGVTQVRT